jgi:transposase
MRVMYERCCGLDIHKASIVACALIATNGHTEQQMHRFGTMTADLKELSTWLQQKRLKHVAMESTGVYWKPVWNILEPEGFELLLANAHDVQVVPAEKRTRTTVNGSPTCTSTDCCGRVLCQRERSETCGIGPGRERS